jgi:ABC-type polar amino acid transport system ATPase subunit
MTVPWTQRKPLEEVQLTTQPSTCCVVEPEPSDALRMESICKQFGTRRVLDNVSFRLRRREVLALCGASGCGKTTLLRIICGLTCFDGGQLIVGQTPIPADAAYPRELYGKVGMVFPEHSLFPHMNAIENVTLALRESRRIPAKQACERGMGELERMGIAALARRYPSNLSSGEKQRVAIARALAMDPLLLLLDEPTANLDPDRVDEVRDRVLELAGSGTTMLLVTHNIDFARRASQNFAVLGEGICRVSNDPSILEDLRRRKVT